MSSFSFENNRNQLENYLGVHYTRETGSLPDCTKNQTVRSFDLAKK